MNNSVSTLAVLGLLVLFFGGCRGDGDHRSDDNNAVIVAQVGDSVLYRDEVLARVPGGISKEDSVAMFEAMVDSWIEGNLLLDYASENIDNLPEIEEKVARFRNRLIIEEYKRNIRSENSEVSEDSIQSWYDKHREDYTLQFPLVKGVFVKVPLRSMHTDRIEKLISSSDEKAIDEFESELMDDVAQYSYFRDNWVDWDVIEELIPHNFGDANAFLEKNKTFRTDYRGMTYLLSIADYVPAGEVMPYPYAVKVINDDIKRRSALLEEKKILKSIREKAVKEGRLKRAKDLSI